MAAGDTTPLAARLAALSSQADQAERNRLILAGLETADAAEREIAVAWAARTFEPPQLTGLMADEANAVLRNAALEALRRQGPYALEHLHDHLRDPDPDLVMFSVQTLDLIASPASIPALLPLLRHPATNVIQVTAEALGHLKAVSAVPSLIELLAGDLWLQLAGIEALGNIGDRRAVAPLLTLYPDGPLAEPVAGALARIAAPEAIPELIAVLAETRWRPLWPTTLLATAAALRSHPDPGGAVQPLGPLVREGEFGAYLRATLDPPAPADRSASPTGAVNRDDRRQARGGTAEQQAAALFALATGEPDQVRSVMRLAADPDWAAWVGAEGLRFQGPLGALATGLVADPDPAVRIGALRTLAPALLALPQVEAQATDPLPEVRTAACLALGRLGHPGAISPLLERLRSGTSEERAAAATALSNLPGAEVVKGLASCLTPETPREVTLAALSALEGVGDSSVEPALLELTRSPSVELRRGALRALARLPGGKGEMTLLRALADRDAGIQSLALDLLVRRGGERVLPTFLMMLQANDSLRHHVIRALGRLGAVEAAPTLQALYADCQLYERLEILTALGRIAAPGRRAFLQERLSDPDLEIRRAAAWAVAEAADREDLPLLRELAGAEDWALRGEAARGLGRIHSEAARPLLLELARDLERVVAGVAVRSLENVAAAGSRG